MTNFELFQLSTEHLWDKSKGPQKEIALDPKTLSKLHLSLHSKFSSSEIGFFDWPSKISEKDLSEMKNHAEFLRREFDGAVVFGIGGSFLGPFAVAEALRSEKEKRNFEIIWISNVDKDAIQRAKDRMQGKRFAAIVTSKSGSTVETLSAFFHLAPNLDPKGYVIITDPEKGELRRLCSAHQWKSFVVPPNIGGRFSVLTSVGLFPVFLSGLNADGLISGARKMRQFFSAVAAEHNPAYELAALQHSWDTQFNHSVHYWMPYQQTLNSLADWNIQLWGESIGKKNLPQGKAVGFTPVGAVGTTDQHSLLQLFKEGPNNKVIGFIDVFDPKSTLKIGRPPFEIRDLEYVCDRSFDEINHLASLATEKSLSNSGVPTYRISLKKVNEETLGALFFFWETACAFAGELYQVDAFNQPGVEEAKKLLRASL